MLISEMPREPLTVTLDIRCTEMLRNRAKESGQSVSICLELILLNAGKLTGEIANDAEPLKELRGGSRPKHRPLKPGEFKYRKAIHRVSTHKGEMIIERYDKQTDSWVKPKRTKPLLMTAAKVLGNSS